jgi:hypothetical protein
MPEVQDVHDRSRLAARVEKRKWPQGHPANPTPFVVERKSLRHIFLGHCMSDAFFARANGGIRIILRNEFDNLPEVSHCAIRN